MTKVFGKYRRLAVLLAVIGFLAGCEAVHSGMRSLTSAFDGITWPWREAEGPSHHVPATEHCPAITIAPDLDRMTQFYVPSQTADSQIVSQIKVSSVKSRCSIDSSGAIVDIDLELAGKLGPKARHASTDRPSFSYPYFVAMSTADGQVSAKEIFAATLAYAQGVDRKTVTENVRQVIPKGGAHRPSEYTIIVGFQLTDEELAYNRKNAQ